MDVIDLRHGIEDALDVSRKRVKLLKLDNLQPAFEQGKIDAYRDVLSLIKKLEGEKEEDYKDW